MNEFLVLMDANSKVYGNTVDEAKITFALEYNSKIVPLAKNSFNSIIEEGNKKGIDWATAKLVRSEIKNISGDDKVFSLEVTISSHNKEFKIEIEKAFFVNNRLHASQFVKLI